MLDYVVTLTPENPENALGENEVQYGHDRRDNRDERNNDGRVCEQFFAGRPDHLAEFCDDLPVEQTHTREKTRPLAIT